METSTKTDVDIIQELLAIYAVRKEACDKMQQQTSDEFFKSLLQKSDEQSERFTKTLLDELSMHGDAVLSDANRSNTYQQLYKQVSPSFEEKDTTALQETFNQLEKRLLDYYQEVNIENLQEPGSLQEMLSKQAAELNEI